MNKLKAIKSIRKSGNESFHNNGKVTGDKLLSFWQWSSSELVGNALRGVLAEYLVVSDVGNISELRQEWDAYDLITPEGIKVEVKSAAYIQSWEQVKHSPIRFGIQETYGWDATTNLSSTTKKRQADIYVFCVLANEDQESIDPMDVSQWEFYVLSTAVLNLEVPNQSTIALSRLKTLNPIKAKYGDIYTAIKSVS